jgi:hypothetical protein
VGVVHVEWLADHDVTHPAVGVGHDLTDPDRAVDDTAPCCQPDSTHVMALSRSAGTP